MAKCKSGCQCRRHIRTDEHNAKIAASERGKYVSSETRQKISASKKGHPAWNKGISTDTSHLQTYWLHHSRKGTTGWKFPNRKPRAVTAEHRRNASIAQKRHADKDLPSCGCVVHAPRLPKQYKVSALSGRMIDALLHDFPEVIPEKEFGRCRVDAYLPPPYHLAFKADGEYWHQVTEEQNPGYYQRRDDYLLNMFGLPVVRLTESEINEAAGV